jgi:AcrR family transcriptional regulator
MGTRNRAPSEGAASKRLTPIRNGLSRTGTPQCEGQPKAHTQRAQDRQASTSEQNGLGREHVSEIQRARILAAMTEVACELGAANLTVAHVVDRAGVSRRTFYELFADREDCFLAAFDESIARVSRHVLAAYDPGAGWAGRIRSALTALLGFLDAERGTGRLLIVEALGAGANALERRRRVLAQIVAAVDEGRREGKAPSGATLLTAEGVVGAVLSVLHGRLSEDAPSQLVAGGSGFARLVDLAGPLMSIVVLPYLGPAASRRELSRPVVEEPVRDPVAGLNPLRDLEMRLTYRTVRVLAAVGANPGSSNRVVGDASGIADQGQVSKLLARLGKLGLIQNTGAGAARGDPNAWTLTRRGWEIHGVIAGQADSV